jgi:hypothetical protein
MKIDKRDWFFIALVAAVLITFFSISGKETTTPVPRDAVHQPAYDEAYRKAPGPDASLFAKTFFKPDKKAAEKLCEPCHDANGIKLPPNHPPKHRCLFCHKLQTK